MTKGREADPSIIRNPAASFRQFFCKSHLLLRIMRIIFVVLTAAFHKILEKAERSNAAMRGYLPIRSPSNDLSHYPPIL